MKEEAEKVLEEYRKYQHGTIGIDVWEEGAFRAGWNAGIESERERIRKEIKERIKDLEGMRNSCDGVMRNVYNGSIMEAKDMLVRLSLLSPNKPTT